MRIAPNTISWLLSGPRLSILRGVGAATKMPVRLTEEYVWTFAEHVPRICEAMCCDEQYSCVDGEFRLETTGTYCVARLYLGKKYIRL